MSQLTKTAPHKGVTEWLLKASSGTIYLSVISLSEIRFGIESMERGRKRSNFEQWLESDIPRMFSGRLIPVNGRVADESGRMLALMKANNRRPDLADALIAATARVHGLDLATLNYKDFDGLPVELVRF